MDFSRGIRDNPEKKRANRRKSYRKHSEKLKAASRFRWKNRGEEDKVKYRGYRIKYQYGISLEDIPELCQVCSAKSKGPTQGICVDHNHNTGEVRGFLCSGCNLALGNANDDPNTLRKLADYLEKGENV